MSSLTSFSGSIQGHRCGLPRIRRPTGGLFSSRRPKRNRVREEVSRPTAGVSPKIVATAGPAGPSVNCAQPQVDFARVEEHQKLGEECGFIPDRHFSKRICDCCAEFCAAGATPRDLRSGSLRTLARAAIAAGISDHSLAFFRRQDSVHRGELELFHRAAGPVDLDTVYGGRVA